MKTVLQGGTETALASQKGMALVEGGEVREQPGEGVGHVHSLLIKMIFRSSGNIEGDEDTEDGNCYLEDLTWHGGGQQGHPH